jgi:hypothetical protein
MSPKTLLTIVRTKIYICGQPWNTRASASLCIDTLLKKLLSFRHLFISVFVFSSIFTLNVLLFQIKPQN